jgi:hypothetical protein
MLAEDRIRLHDECASAMRRAAWCLARAAACPWYRPLRRYLLVIAAYRHHLEANAHATELAHEARIEQLLAEAMGGDGA